MTGAGVRADLVAGITVALILVPQGMAYAQLAGLPVVYGLYASFVPVIVASLWGSCSQLHTGPVAMLSLMSAAALIPFASPGGTDFIELSIMLALMVGILRLGLGLFKLGAVVNLLSSPVIVGFTNAAALIIGLSQLSKIIGVPFPRSDFYLADLWGVIGQIDATHWPTLAFAIGAYALIVNTKRIAPRVPGVLIAVLLTTVISALIGFEKKAEVSLAQIHSPAEVESIEAYAITTDRIDTLTTQISRINREITGLKSEGDLESITRLADAGAAIQPLEYERNLLKAKNNKHQIKLHQVRLERVDTAEGVKFYPYGEAPYALNRDADVWRFAGISGNSVTLSSGGAVVGEIPTGLPTFALPPLQWNAILGLLPAAIVMALIGFMEATSISKAIATTTGERIDTSKELVGQGMANIAGSFFGSYAVSGSFSRSAVAARTGARTGLFAIISALAVVLVLLFFTPYLYSLPQSVLAVIVMMAVFSLIRVKPLVHAWKVNRTDSIIGFITFFATLAMAPAIADGILLGIALTLVVFLIKGMKPRAEIVARKPDGTLGGIKAHGLTPISRFVVPVRFDGSLTFSNVAYFEDAILDVIAGFPECKAIVIIGSSINEIDASGEEKIREVGKQLRQTGIELHFSGLKHQVLSTLERTGLVDEYGRDHFFPNKEVALQKLLASHGYQPA